jgi:hypothetical protein
LRAAPAHKLKLRRRLIWEGTGYGKGSQENPQTGEARGEKGQAQDQAQDGEAQGAEGREAQGQARRTAEQQGVISSAVQTVTEAMGLRSKLEGRNTFED